MSFFKSFVALLLSAGLLASCAHSPNAAAAGQSGADSTKSFAPTAPTPVFAGSSNSVGGDNQTYYFSFDGSNINQDELDSIHAQADYLIANPQSSVRLEGNTDDRGSREYNVALGWRRDQSVQHILLQSGVDPKQIAMLSYGKERPAVIGDDESAWSKNRRVNLIYEAK
jgi:peptidoglycan-associated lipoprotein